MKKKNQLNERELQAFLDFWTGWDDEAISPYMYEKWNDTAYYQITKLIEKSMINIAI